MKTLLISLTIISVSLPTIASVPKGVIVPWDSETCVRRGGVPRGELKCYLPPIK
jgi:hypothetical protein